MCMIDEDEYETNSGACKLKLAARVSFKAWQTPRRPRGIAIESKQILPPQRKASMDVVYQGAPSGAPWQRVCPQRPRLP